VKRAERNNAIDTMVSGQGNDDDSTIADEWTNQFDAPVHPLTKVGRHRSLMTLNSQAEIDEWTGKLANVVLSSDAFFPFRDNIDRAIKVRCFKFTPKSLFTVRREVRVLARRLDQ